jgi:DNA-directed RNA polymerase subunit RPC12/RpoP
MTNYSCVACRAAFSLAGAAGRLRCPKCGTEGVVLVTDKPQDIGSLSQGPSGALLHVKPDAPRRKSADWFRVLITVVVLCIIIDWVSFNAFLRAPVTTAFAWAATAIRDSLIDASKTSDQRRDEMREQERARSAQEASIRRVEELGDALNSFGSALDGSQEVVTTVPSDAATKSLSRIRPFVRPDFPIVMEQADVKLHVTAIFAVSSIKYAVPSGAKTVKSDGPILRVDFSITNESNRSAFVSGCFVRQDGGGPLIDSLRLYSSEYAEINDSPTRVAPGESGHFFALFSDPMLDPSSSENEPRYRAFLVLDDIAIHPLQFDVPIDYEIQRE